MTTPQIDNARIAETAFRFWLDEGQPQGRDQDHWYRAIETLKSAPAAKKRKAAKTAKPKAAAAAKPRAKKPARA